MTPEPMKTSPTSPVSADAGNTVSAAGTPVAAPTERSAAGTARPLTGAAAAAAMARQCAIACKGDA